ncbi:MAG: ArsR family transcriptional regulator [Methanospirillaceae archaeon]|nr:ArsR family transcriptional regulator [Methanospirillaceae archaeon]
MDTVTIDGKNLLVLTIEKGTNLSSLGGVVYIRIGTGIRPLSVQEILMLSAELGTVAWDESPIIGRDAMRYQYISWFFKKLQESRGKLIPDKQRDRYLRSAKAIRGNMLTNAGLLFFTDVSEYLPFAKIRIITMQNKEPVASREYEGPVWSTIESAYQDLLRELHPIDIIIGTQRKKIEYYPPRAIREAIINAITHRSYIIAADTRIFIHDDHIEIRNPGGLLPGVDLNDPEHIPRNPAIAHLFHDTGFSERYGYGIHMIREEVKKNPLCDVSFSSSTGSFTVIFSKKIPSDIDKTDRFLLDKLKNPQKSSELAYSLGISKPTVIRRLKQLKERGLIVQEGSGAHTRYRVP